MSILIASPPKKCGGLREEKLEIHGNIVQFPKNTFTFSPVEKFKYSNCFKFKLEAAASVISSSKFLWKYWIRLEINCDNMTPRLQVALLPPHRSLDRGTPSFHRVLLWFALPAVPLVVLFLPKDNGTVDSKSPPGADDKSFISCCGWDHFWPSRLHCRKRWSSEIPPQLFQVEPQPN